jgi:hypothetical protein
MEDAFVMNFTLENLVKKENVKMTAPVKAVVRVITNANV